MGGKYADKIKIVVDELRNRICNAHVKQEAAAGVNISSARVIQEGCGRLNRCVLFDRDGLSGLCNFYLPHGGNGSTNGAFCKLGRLQRLLGQN